MSTTESAVPPALSAPDLPVPGPRGGIERPGDLASLLAATRRHGDIVCIAEAPQRVFLVSHPDHVKHVVQDHHAGYRQNVRKKVLMGRRSLALSAGEEWRKRRRLLQPLFHRERLAALAGVMTGATERRLARWDEAAAARRPLDVAGEMVGLTLDILIESLLGEEADRRGSLRRAVETAFDYFNARLRRARPLPVAVPTPGNLRLLLALRQLRGAVGRTVAERRAGGAPGTDLLSLMIAAHDEQTGEVLDDGQLLDELMMLLVMGHMTTAMGITWAWHLLARHPEAEERVRAEIAEVAGDRPPGFADLPRLAYTRRAVDEVLRLYPPSWSFSRFALADDEVGGFLVPAGSVVMLCPWVTHRRPELWEEPERFDPDRFLPERSADRPRFAYYPFGGGPRVCIARELALMELPLVLATVARRYRLRPVPGRAVVPVTGITLQPRRGLPMTLEPPAAPPRAGGERPPLATLAGLLPLAARRSGPAALHKVDGRFVPLPEAELLDLVRRVAGALLAAGIAPGDRVALLAGNGPGWAAAELAALAVGAVTVPLAPELPPEEAVRLLAASGARLAFVDGRWAGELAGRGAELPALERRVRLDGDGEAEGTETLAGFLARGADRPPPDLERLAAERRPEEPATLAYTPGTSGAPKGVLLSHGNAVAAVLALAGSLDVRPGDVAYSSRTLADPVERAFHYLYRLRGATVAYGSPETAEADLRQVGPHVATTGPADWKRLLDWLFQGVQALPPWRERLFRRAVATGRWALPWRLQGRRPPGFGRLRLALADRVAFDAVRARLGGRLRWAVSTGARIPHGWITFLWAAGIPVYEGWGLAEAAGLATLNTPAAVKPGTAGAPLPGVELRIAADGELLLRGESVARRGWDGTAPAVDGQGFLHTGDAGWLDPAAMLELLGRKEEIAADASGHRIAPGPLESLLRSSHFVAEALVVVRGVPGALLAPAFEALAKAFPRLAAGAASPAELLRQPRVREVIGNEVKNFNEKLPEAERIRVWELTPDRWTVTGGELAWTGSLRRGALLERYAGEIERMFAER